MLLKIQDTARRIDDHVEIDDLVSIMRSISYLTRDDGDALTLFADAPSWACALRVKVFVKGKWVNGPGQAMEFFGDTLRAALDAAVKARLAMERPHWQSPPAKHFQELDSPTPEEK